MCWYPLDSPIPSEWCGSAGLGFVHGEVPDPVAVQNKEGRHGLTVAVGPRANRATRRARSWSPGARYSSVRCTTAVRGTAHATLFVPEGAPFSPQDEHKIFPLKRVLFTALGSRAFGSKNMPPRVECRGCGVDALPPLLPASTLHGHGKPGISAWTGTVPALGLGDVDGACASACWGLLGLAQSIHESVLQACKQESPPGGPGVRAVFEQEKGSCCERSSSFIFGRSFTCPQKHRSRPPSPPFSLLHAHIKAGAPVILQGTQARLVPFFGTTGPNRLGGTGADIDPVGPMAPEIGAKSM